MSNNVIILIQVSMTDLGAAIRESNSRILAVAIKSTQFRETAEAEVVEWVPASAKSAAPQCLLVETDVLSRCGSVSKQQVGQ